MRNCAFVDFQHEGLAYQAQRQLNGLRFLGKVLKVERATSNSGKPLQDGKKDSVSVPPTSTSSSGYNPYIKRETQETEVSRSEPIAPRLGVDYCFPPHLELQLYGVVEHKVQGDGNCQDIGGCDIQKQEIREAVELPLTHHDLYKQIGIDPPRGVLLYGPPETGKTMLAKAVANHTAAAFVRVVGSEFVQKHLGEGPRMVRDVFRLAKENAPAIIFIDEVDAIATARFDAQIGASSL